MYTVFASSPFNFKLTPALQHFASLLFSGLLIEPLALSQDNTTNSVATDGFQLSTERRAKERLDFEREKSEREALRALQEQERLREQEEQERDQVARLRQELVSCLSLSKLIYSHTNSMLLKWFHTSANA